MSLALIQQTIQDKTQYIQNAQSILDQLKANNIELIQQLLDYAETFLKMSSNEPIIRKFLLMRLIKDACVNKSAKLINGLANHKALLQTLDEICMFDAGNSDDNRGKSMFKNQGNNYSSFFLTSDPQQSAQFLRLTLELVSHLGTAYPQDAKKSPTKFKSLLDSLKQRKVESFFHSYKKFKVQFPDPSELMQPLKKPAPKSGIDSSSSQQIQPSQISQPPQQIKQQSALEPKLQDQQPMQQSNQQKKNQDMLKLNEIKAQVMEDIKMIFETLSEGEGEMDYVNDVLETYSASFVEQQKPFDTQFQIARNYQDTLSQDEIANLNLISDFLSAFPKIFQQYALKKQTAEAFNQLKKKILDQIKKIYGQDYGPTPNEDQAQREQANKEYLQKQEALRREEQQRKEEQQRREEQQRKDQERAEQQKRQEQQKREQQERLEQQRKQLEIEEQQKKDQQIKDQREREEREHREQERRQQEKRDHQEEERIQRDDNISFNQQKKQNSGGGFNDLFQTRQQPSQVSDLLKSGKQSFGGQREQIQQSLMQKQNSDDSDYLYQFQDNSPNFQEKFDSLSMSNVFQQNSIPYKNLHKLPEKERRTGRLIQFDDFQFLMLFQYQQNEQQIKKFKLANLRSKACLVDTKELQVF